MEAGHHLDIETNEIESCQTNRPGDIWSAAHMMLNHWHQREADCQKKWNQLYNALQQVLEQSEMKTLDIKIRESDGSSYSCANGDVAVCQSDIHPLTK